MPAVSLGAGLAALGFWSCIAVIVAASIWSAVRRRETQHETLRRLLESGQSVDRAVMDRLLSPGGGGERLAVDLKVAGLIVVFAAPGLAFLGWLVGQQAAPWLLPIEGAAVLVGCVGAGLLVASSSVGRGHH